VLAEKLHETDVRIQPLTFLQTVQIVRMLSASEIEPAPHLAPGHAMPSWLRDAPLAPRLGLPLYHHWATCGFVAMSGTQPVGWVFLRGWRQVLYVETLLVHTAWREHGIEAHLLRFAEEQARELHRRWIGLTVDGGDEPEWFRANGYRRGHWRVMVCPQLTAVPEPTGERVELRRLYGGAAHRAYLSFSRQDVLTGEQPADDILTRYLARDPYRRSGRSWHIMYSRQPIAYVNLSTSAGGATVYVAAAQGWWGSAPLLAGIARVLQEHVSAPARVTIRLASTGHHEAAREPLAAWGFEEQPATLVRLYKPLDAGTG